jgi:archaellum component FlaF (FlaF/FlaG flagellin family)/uncharacterized protein YdhG (YjbR/CyaY superfamily)
MPQIKQSATSLRKKRTWSFKKKIVIVAVIIFVASLVTFASVFAYQVYLENIQTDQNDGCSSSTQCQDRHFEIDKPVIYLYPTKTENVNVKLEYAGKLVSTYPSYDKTINGWQVTANPDGTLTNRDDNKEYSYLFWEGIGNTDYSKIENGFVVKGSDTKDFLQSTLSSLGLTPREYNEMIVYWLPKMENNKYNLIHFAGKEYTDSAKLTVTPTPDSILRVFMVFKPLEKYYQIPQQQITTFNRKGFAVVEWGGTEIE